MLDTRRKESLRSAMAPTTQSMEEGTERCLGYTVQYLTHQKIVYFGNLRKAKAYTSMPSRGFGATADEKRRANGGSKEDIHAIDDRLIDASSGVAPHRHLEDCDPPHTTRQYSGFATHSHIWFYVLRSHPARSYFLSLRATPHDTVSVNATSALFTSC